MTKRWASTIALLAFASSASVAQTPPPKPSAEQLRFLTMVGHWSFAGEDKKTALSAAEHWTGPDHTFELFPGGYFLVHRWEDKNDHGQTEIGLEVMSYDAAKKVYVTKSYTSLGEAASYVFTWVGDTLRFSDDTLKFEGKKGLERCALVIARNTQTLDCKVSLDGKLWAAASHGVWTRRP